MSFLAPLFLLGALTIALPFWLHRLQTQSSDRKPFSSAMLLETTDQQIHVRKQLKYLLLLALRVLLLLLIVLVFAKPLWTDPETLPGPGPDGTHIVLVDTSASMARDGVFERAADAAGDALSAAPGGALLQLISASNGIRIESDLSSDASSQMAALGGLAPTNARLDFGRMMTALDRHAESLPAPVTLHLVSDFQDSGMPVRFADLVSARIETLELHPIQGRRAVNWSVQAIRETAAGVDVTVIGTGDEDMSARVDTALNGVELGTRILEGSGPSILSFEALLLEEGDNRIAVTVEADDDFAADNRRYQVIDNQPPSPIPLITFDQGGLPGYLDPAEHPEAHGDWQVAPLPPDLRMTPARRRVLDLLGEGPPRTGPDLARVGGRYSDDWQRLHLMDPRALVPESNMPGYPWLAERMVDPELITKKLETLQFLGDPYTDAQISGAAAAVEGKTELDALIAYLQGLGTNRSNRR